METGGGRQHATRGPAGLGLPLGLAYSSLLLNAVFLAHHFILSPSLLFRDDDGGGSCGLTWSLQAAREAEAVAAVECSGHGQVFLDGIAGEDGRPGCECNSCFGGPDCSLRTPNCTADADSGNPLFLEPYWRRHAAASAVVFSGWHRMSYTTTGRFQSVELERQIRRLHRAVGNAVADDKHLVFASGSLQLINALVHALSPDAMAAKPPSRVVAAAPYYPSYRLQTSMFDGREYRWAGTTALWTNASRTNSTDGFIEFVTSPNNPDAMLRKPVLCSSASAIVDHAYYWPHFTHIPAAADEDIMMFTISKPSGHAGSRFGWALIRDDEVAQRALDYLSNSNMGASRDTQLRMLGIVRFMLANLHGKDDIFGFGHDVMRSRWRRLSAVVSRSRRISLQRIPPNQYCTYFDRVREPSPAYAWVKCEREEDDDCYEALLKARIITRSGSGYDASSRYTRVSLLKSDDDFQVLMDRVTDLVNAENYDGDALLLPRAPCYGN